MSEDGLLYFDYAAATPLSDVALRAMRPYFSEKFFNPSSPYAPAIQVHREYEAAKHELAVAIGGKADDIVVTAGATESINLAMTAAGGGHIVTSAIEHHAVLHAARRHDVSIVDVPRSGIVDAQAIRQAIRSDTQLVSIALANNELGTIQPLRDIATVIEAERLARRNRGDKTPLWFHSDASQGVGQIDINVARLGVDLITINAAKCYGPKQVALLWRKPGVALTPLVYGGGQELGLRSGTENVAGTIGFAAALTDASQKRKSESKRLGDLRDLFEQLLVEGNDPLQVTIPGKKRLPGSLHVMIPGVDAERLIFLLETKGVFVATGSACAANSGTRSHVLTAIGLTDAEADGSLRITLGRHSTEAQVRRGAEAIIDAVRSEIERVRK